MTTIHLPLLGGVEFAVVQTEEEFLAIARERKRVFLEVELASILNQKPTAHQMEWALIQKRIKPGCWVLDIQKRVLGYPDVLRPDA